MSPLRSILLVVLATHLAVATAASSALTQLATAQVPDRNSELTNLSAAQSIVQGAVWDSTAARPLLERNDTTALRQMRSAFAAQLEAARPHLAATYASPDTTIQFAAAAMGLGGGMKLAVAGAHEAAYQWLDDVLTRLGPQTARESGLRQWLRSQASFWFSVSSTVSLGAGFRQLLKDRDCDEARALNDRIERSLQAIVVGGSVGPTVAAKMQDMLIQYAAQMQRVRSAFKCTSF